MSEEQTQPVEQQQEQPAQTQEQTQENVSHETSQPTTTEPAPRPEHIPEKFWDATKGEVNLEEFGKSYTNLEKYVGGKKEELRDQIVDELQQEAIAERPEKVEGYELPKLPEGVTEELVNANPMTDWWKNFCYENAYDQEVYQEGINKYVDSYIGNQVDPDAEKQKLGENADAMPRTKTIIVETKQKVPLEHPRQKRFASFSVRKNLDVTRRIRERLCRQRCRNGNLFLRQLCTQTILFPHIIGPFPHRLRIVFTLFTKIS